MIHDPIADMLTRIRNGIRANQHSVEIRPLSKIKLSILDILKKEGFISEYKVTSEQKGGTCEVILKYDKSGVCVIEDLQRVSKPSIRVYVDKDHIPWTRNGLGISIISTSQGLITDREARKRKIGGEILLSVW